MIVRIKNYFSLSKDFPSVSQSVTLIRETAKGKFINAIILIDKSGKRIACVKEAYGKFKDWRFDKAWKNNLPVQATVIGIDCHKNGSLLLQVDFDECIRAQSRYVQESTKQTSLFK